MTREQAIKSYAASRRIGSDWIARYIAALRLDRQYLATMYYERVRDAADSSVGFASI